MLRRFISYASTIRIVEVGNPQGAGERDGGLPSRMICLANHDAAVAAARTVRPPCPKEVVTLLKI